MTRFWILLNVDFRDKVRQQAKTKGDLTPKAHRLTRLRDVVTYLQKSHSEIQKGSIKSFIENARVTIDPTDVEEGSTTLLNLIIEEPESRTWVPCVEEAIKNYGGSFIGSGQAHETHRSVRQAR